METVESEVVYTPEEIAKETEVLCRWGAARAGAIVVLPVVGSMTLTVNEFYMINKLAKLRGIKLTERMISSFIGALMGKFVGQTLATLIPVAVIQLPIAITTTYAVGKVAAIWMDKGCPEDISGFQEVFEDAKKQATDILDELKNYKDKDKPLGDENKKM